jgi:hypothetical protein
MFYVDNFAAVNSFSARHHLYCLLIVDYKVICNLYFKYNCENVIGLKSCNDKNSIRSKKKEVKGAEFTNKKRRKKRKVMAETMRIEGFQFTNIVTKFRVIRYVRML